MSDYTALSSSTHAGHHWRPRRGYGFAADRAVVPVLLAELSQLLGHYVLGFIRTNERLQAVAVVGLGEQRNLYLHDDGRWLAPYVPARLRGYPFLLTPNEQGQQVLCIERSHLIEEATDEGEALFDESGELAPPVRRSVDFLQQCEQSRQQTDAACARLDEAGVITPWPLEIRPGENAEPIRMQGLYRLDEQALNQLKASSFAELRRHGALALAYAQIFSQTRHQQLEERARHLLQHRSRTSQAMEQDTLDQLFSGDDDDELVFDFDN